VRAIRNEFAHHPEYITFDEPSVADRCRELTYTWHEKNERPRAHYAATVSGIVAIVHASIAHAVSPSEATHTPIDDELRKRINAQADAALQSLKTDGNKPPENGDG